MKVKITIDKRAVRLKAENRWNSRVQVPLTLQVVKDANKYCPMDEGTLMDSAQTASQPEKGIAAWNTAYAKKRYYTGTPKKDRNPNASLMWAEKAKNIHKKEWNAIAQKEWDG